MIQFWIITSIGHCATKWLSEVLDSRPYVTATHELKMSVSGMAWDKAAEYERRNGAESAKYRPYFEQIQAADTSIVVDANSWVPWMLPSVNEMQPIARVIYIVRHPISQLHSLWEHSAVWRDSDIDSYVYNDYLRRFWDITGEPPGPLENLNRWGRLCMLWRVSSEVPKVLRNFHDLTVDVFPFEELTQRRPALRSLLPDATEVERQEWRLNDINRKVDGTRRPVDLWPRWTPEQQQSFAAICGPGMARYGYEIPGAEL